MQERQPRREAPGETSPSPQRPPQIMGGPAMLFDVESEVARLRQEESWTKGNKNAKTLVKEPDLRVVLSLLKRDARIEQHAAEGRTIVQVLSGKVRVQLARDHIELGPGNFLMLDRSVDHEVIALDESELLLTLAWPIKDAESPKRGPQAG